MISLIDAVNHLDCNNQPMGHGLKELRDLSVLFSKKAEILAGQEYIQSMKGKGIKLPYCNYTAAPHYFNVKVIFNYLVSLFKANGDVLIYTNVPEALLWGIALFKNKKKIVIVSFENWDNYIKNMSQKRIIPKFLVKRGLSRLDGCLVTNLQYKPQVPYIRIPDYYITKEISLYSKKEKEFGCVCLGEIRPDKDIVGLITIMRKKDIPLLIAGSFQDKKVYQIAKKYQTDNIKIENRNLNYRDYLDYLSKYKYLILPYDEKSYDGRTSGVLQEGIFVGAIPIAPRMLLRQNKIQGLEYQKISEIPDLICAYEEGKIKIENRLERYQLKNYKNKLMKFTAFLENNAKKKRID